MTFYNFDGLPESGRMYGGNGGLKKVVPLCFFF